MNRDTPQQFQMFNVPEWSLCMYFLCYALHSYKKPVELSSFHILFHYPSGTWILQQVWPSEKRSEEWLVQAQAPRKK